MKRYIITILLLVTCAIASAQVGGVTRKGEVTTEKNHGTVDYRGQIVDCPSLTPSGEIIEYNSSITSWTAGLDGTVDIALSITVSSIGNADSVGFECATDANFTSIFARKSYQPVEAITYQDTFKLLTPGTTYYVRAYIANCPGTVYSDTIDVTVTSSATYTLSFFAHGGTGSMSDQDFTDGVSKKITANTFTRANADFAGWATDPSGCGTLYADTALMTLTVDDSLYAQWNTWCTGSPRTINERGTSRIDSVKDHQDNWYKVVQIGTQCWLAENMRATTEPSSGTSILQNPFSSLSYSEPRAYYYNDNASNYTKYGCLYNFSAAMDINDQSTSFTYPHRGICPEGWHIPQESEFDTLAIRSGCTDNYNTGTGLANLTTGCEWTAHGSDQETYPGNYSYTERNSTGFSLLPAGYHDNTRFLDLNVNIAIWSSNTYNTTLAWCRYFTYNNQFLYRAHNDRTYAFSVRCVRDAEVKDTITFDANLGTGTMPNQTAVRGVKVELNSNEFARTGNFEFAGWNTDRGGCGTAYADGDSITTSGNMTLYAQWSGYCSGMARTNESGTGRIDSLQDVDGNWYNVVTMPNGTCWMAENLRTTKYASGTTIPNGSETSTTDPYWYYPNNTASNKATYGLLYNWTALMNGASSSNANPSGVQGVCPVGWHVPSHSEWTQLTSSVGSQVQYQCGDDATQIAKALASTTGWSTSTNDCAPGNDLCSNNATLFGAMPAGYYNQQGYENFSNHANFWTSTLVSGDLVYNRVIVNTNNTIAANSKNRFNGFSVRCVRDTNTVATITFDANNGSGSTSTQTAPYLRDTVLDANTFSKTNATFAGWNTDRSGCGTSYADQATINVSGDVTLYAQWKTYCPVAARSNEMGSVAGRIDSVKDHQDNWYKVVQIGDQCWLKENMRVTTSPKGNLTAGGSNQSYYKAYYYDYSTATQFSLRERGYLYNWAGAIDTNATSKISASFTGRRGICPEGWHLPTDDEWKTMEGGYLTETDGTTPISASTLNNSDYRGKGAGKFTGGCDWTTSSSTTAPGNYSYSDRNVTGFSVLPAGNCLGINLSDAGDNAHFWSTTSTNSERAWRWRFHYNQEGVDRYNGTKDYGRSVRCVRDTNTSVTITFDANNGSGTMPAQTVRYLRDTVLDANTFDKTNCTFAGWNTDRSGCGTSYADQASVALSSNLTLYAQWNTYCTVAARNNETGSVANRIDSVKDHQDNWYKVVQIGNQCWLKENMRATTEPGSSTSILQNPASGSSSSDARAYYYGNNDANYAKYGCLYNFPAAMNINTTTSTSTFTYPHRGICPEGWHVPQDSEWDTLAIRGGCTARYNSGTGSGKLTGGCDWTTNSSTTAPGNYSYSERNSSGFTALPAGQRESDFNKVGEIAIFWSSTPNGSNTAYDRYLYNNRTYVDRSSYNRGYGYSVRCVRDTNTVATITFDANNGSGSTTTQTARYLRDTVLDANTFYKTNCTFAGWNTERSGLGTTYDDRASVRPSYNLTLYAQWNTYCPVAARSNEMGNTTHVDSLIDHAGNSYAVLSLNGYCVMKSNLRVKSSPVGNRLDSVAGLSADVSRYFTDNSYGTEGYLYNWHAAMDLAEGVNGSSITSLPDNHRGLCPEGWHIPKRSEWAAIISGYDNGQMSAYNGTFQGTDWSSSTVANAPGNTTDADKNITGFTAIPVGDYADDGRAHKGTDCYIWDSECNSSDAGRLSLTYNLSSAELNACYKRIYRSVRCVRDTNTVATITFDANGGSGSTTTQTVRYLSDTVLDANTFTKTNATFAGWNTDRSGTGTAYTDAASVRPSSNLTLYAQWNTYCTGMPLANEKGTGRIDSLVDYDGNSYAVVQIGNQCWMKQSLRVHSKPDGTALTRATSVGTGNAIYFEPTGNVTTYLPSGSTSSITAQQYKEKYGGTLYNWNTATQGAAGQGICPDGWHIPTLDEFDTLRTTTGTASDNVYRLATGNDWAKNGTSATHPANGPHTDASDRNSSGFSAIPQGVFNGSFASSGLTVHFWTSNIVSTTHAYDAVIDWDQKKLGKTETGQLRERGMAVRCVRNTPAPATISFDANGGTGTMPAMNVTTMRDTVLDPNSFSRSGNFAFANWNTDRNGCGTSYADEATINVSGNVTLYAQWKTYCTGTPGSNEEGIGRIDSVKDIDNNWYKVVQIGSQCWLAENMKATKYADNTDILLGSSSSDEVAYRYYPNNAAANVDAYGYLYNWKAYMHNASPSEAVPSGVQGVCPDGWHLPSAPEWVTMLQTVAPSADYSETTTGFKGASTAISACLAGGCSWREITATTQSAGNYSDTNRNISCFSAIPAAYYNGTTDYPHFGEWALFVTSTGTCRDFIIEYNSAGIRFNNNTKSVAGSVRCVRNN